VLPAETVLLAKLVDAVNAAVEEDLDHLDPQASLDDPETLEPPESPDNPENLFPLLASSLSNPHANPVQEANQETQDPQAHQDSQDNQEDQDNPEETLSQAHQVPLDPQASPETQEDQEDQDNPELQPQARLLPHRPQAHLGSKDPLDSQDTQEDLDNPVAQDSPARRDPQARLETLEAMVNPANQETLVSQETRAALVFARNTAPWTVVCSLPTALDVHKLLKEENWDSGDKIEDHNRERHLFPFTTKITFHAFIITAARIICMSSKTKNCPLLFKFVNN